MHLVTTRPVVSDLPIFFNVDTSVGKGGQNSSQEDILLVQFLLQATAEASPPAKGSADAIRQRAANLPVTGLADAATTDCIHAWQEARKPTLPGTIVDGRVNPARGVLYAKGGEWTIVDLNAVFRRFFPKIWPRLHDHPKCPALLKTRVPQVL
jgi:hypothetical protein